MAKFQWGHIQWRKYKWHATLIFFFRFFLPIAGYIWVTSEKSYVIYKIVSLLMTSSDI